MNLILNIRVFSMLQISARVLNYTRNRLKINLKKYLSFKSIEIFFGIFFL